MNTKRKEETTKRFDLGLYPMFFFAHILHRYDLNMAYEMRRHKLNNSMWRILATLQYRDGLTIKQLSIYTTLERSVISRLVVMMETRELVMRFSPDDDRRSTCVSITKLGLKTFSKIMQPVVSKHLGLTFRRVTARDLAKMLAIMNKVMIDVYDVASEEPPSLDG